MSEFKSEDAYPTMSVQERLRKNAIWCFAGGVALIVVNLIATRAPILSFVAGGIICAMGIGWFMANNPLNKKIGIFIVVVGALRILSGVPVVPVFRAIPVLLNVVAMWLLATGVRNLVSYFITQGKRFS